MSKKQIDRAPEMKFNSRTEYEQAQRDLKNLQRHPGWVRLVEFYKGQIAHYDRLLKSGNIENMERYHRIIDRINLAQKFIDLPDMLTALQDLQHSEVSLDPYDPPPVESA